MKTEVSTSLTPLSYNVSVPVYLFKFLFLFIFQFSLLAFTHNVDSRLKNYFHLVVHFLKDFDTNDLLLG